MKHIDSKIDFDFPVVNCPYLSSNIPESPAYGVFVSQLIRYARGCSKYEDFLFRGSILVSNYWSRDIIHVNFRVLFGNSMVVIQTLFTNLTPLCWRVCSPTVTYDWFPVIWGKSWRVPHMGQKVLTLFGTPDFTPFGEFIIAPIHYICTTEFVCLRTMFMD